MEVENKEWLTWEEIRKRYPEEWVVMGECTLNEFTELVGGVVYHHLKDKHAARKLWGPIGGISACRWTGEHFGLYSHLGTEYEDSKKTPARD
ncbi:MAG: hypothetical protein HY303_03025 [Candidatus Wallbacteria bacterium]|nr:hypothetical protein [Candidatus Wallbacteria bacterium]